MTTRPIRHLVVPVTLMSVLLSLLLAGNASASKEAIAYFGTESSTGTLGGEFTFPGDMAVNSSGAGPADAGDIYVVDGTNRIQRFAQDDNGTPANPYDDSYLFISAWGADVDGATTGGSAYEVCTVAAQCKAGVAVGGNGDPSGNGDLSGASGIAVDQDTGEVFVADRGNNRVTVYAGDGAFLRAFGWDVVESGPGESGTGYEVCVAADGDVCKAGTSGAGVGQTFLPNSIEVSQPDGNPATGTVFLGDQANTRVGTFDLDGSNPGSFGSSTEFSPYYNSIAVDSRGIVYVGDRQNQQEIDRYDSQNANGGGVGFLASIPAPPVLPSDNNGSVGLEIDPDSDGGGPDVDTLYVLRTVAGDGIKSVVQQFGPANAPGLTVPPSAVDDVHGSLAKFNFTTGLGLDVQTGRIFLSSFSNVGSYQTNIEEQKSGVYVLDTAGGAPSATLDSVSDVTATTATVNATVNPNGGPPVGYHLEYSLNGSDWFSTPEVTVGTQESPQAIAAVLDPPGTGLSPGTFYHVRMVVQKVFTPAVITAEKTFTTLTAAPEVETVGSPIRTATTARLEGRLNPRGQATTYRFEYGSQGPCEANPCEATPAQAAGAGSEIGFVSQAISGLAPGTTYHFRLVAENGTGSSPGGDMTVTTRAGDAPLSHGHFPGPPGSDRAWEQVNLPETGGNPVAAGYAFSDGGDRAIYQIPGGTPITDSGSAFNQFFAERTASGWQSRQILPGREDVVGPNWLPPFAAPDLSRIFAFNANLTSGQRAFWRLQPGGTPKKLLAIAASGYGRFFLASEDLSRTVVSLVGSADPEHPAPPKTENLYDIGSGTPQLLSLMPNGDVSVCGVGSSKQGLGLPTAAPRRTDHWLSPDGSLLFFPSQGDDCASETQLYMRDIPGASTIRVSKPALSGQGCGAGFVKSTPGAVFFWTQARLVTEDSPASNCTSEQGGDVYRYDLETDETECVTCVVSGLDADVRFNLGDEFGGPAYIAIAEDGSRLYFSTANQLMPGAGTPGAYRVDVATGELAYVAPLGGDDVVGDYARRGNALNPDGSVLIFRSAAAGLNQLNGSQNGGTAQYYRYDDDSRSLVCASCPQDGSPAAAGAIDQLASPAALGQVGPNSDPLSDDGTFVFSTPTPLQPADQNTAGTGDDPVGGIDLYEWRDGRVLLVSDGLTHWPALSVAPIPSGISPSGRDVFFTASARYTADALDSYNRLYDARIGGGFDFPEPPTPCPLEVCQGIPKGAPEEPSPTTGSFSGPGNVKPAAKKPRGCPKGKRKVRRKGKVRCVKAQKRQHRHHRQR